LKDVKMMITHHEELYLASILPLTNHDTDRMEVETREGLGVFDNHPSEQQTRSCAA
jgi:hypothetical protein